MSDLVFISFCKNDIDFVSSLLETLHNEGIPAWTYLDIPPGESISEHIERALDNSRAFVVVLSRSSMKSRWVLAEIHAVHHKLMSTGYPSIIPLLLEDCELPNLLKDLSDVDFTSGFEEPARRLVNRLRDLLAIETTTRDELRNYWFQKYRAGTPQETQAAIEVLFSMGSCEEATEVLGDAELQDELTKRGIARRLPYYIASHLLPHYRRLAASGDSSLAPSGWLCMVNLGDQSAFYQLLTLVATDSTEMRQNVLRNIARVEGMRPGELREATKAVRSCLRDPDPRVRQTALDTAMKLKGALAESGRLRRSVIAEVRRLLNDPNSEVVRLAEHAFRYLDS